MDEFWANSTYLLCLNKDIMESGLNPLKYMRLLHKHTFFMYAKKLLKLSYTKNYQKYKKNLKIPLHTTQDN